MNNAKIENLYDLDKTIAADLFKGHEYPWELLPLIGDFIKELGAKLDPEVYEKRGEDIWVAKSAKVFDSAYLSGPLIIDENHADEYIKRGDDVWIHKTATVFDSAYIHGPAIIGAETEVRQCAFVRGNALVGKGCVVGNSTELKNVIIFDNVQVPHYNYVGDSILGFKSHMGAGSITSNVKSDKTLVVVKGYDENADLEIETGLKKFGAMLGDYVEVGCNSVLNPGSVIGRHTNIYPLSPIRGYVPENSIVKTGNVIISKRS